MEEIFGLHRLMVESITIDYSRCNMKNNMHSAIMRSVALVSMM